MDSEPADVDVRAEIRQLVDTVRQTLQHAADVSSPDAGQADSSTIQRDAEKCQLHLQRIREGLLQLEKSVAEEQANGTLSRAYLQPRLGCSMPVHSCRHPLVLGTQEALTALTKLAHPCSNQQAHPASLGVYSAWSPDHACAHLHLPTVSVSCRAGYRGASCRAALAQSRGWRVQRSSKGCDRFPADLLARDAELGGHIQLTVPGCSYAGQAMRFRICEGPRAGILE